MIAEKIGRHHLEQKAILYVRPNHLWFRGPRLATAVRPICGGTMTALLPAFNRPKNCSLWVCPKD